jgi:hypothetical protein
MIVAIDLPTAQAGIAGIDGRTAHGTPLGVLAIQGLGESPGDGLELDEIRAVEKIGVAESAALETALKQFHGILLFGEGGEGHGPEA